MAILYETDELILENEYEATWLKEKSTGKVLLEDDFYCDPECGLIDDNNNWAILLESILQFGLRKNIKSSNMKM